MATPINKLKQSAPSVESSGAGSELIDNVLKAVGDDCSGSQCAMPNKKGGEDCSVNSSDTNSIDNEQLIKSAMKQANNNNGDLVSSLEASEQADKMIDQMLGANRNKRSMTDRIIDEAREPFLVIVLFVIFNTGFFSNLLTKYLGKFLSSGTELNYFGVAAHATLFGLVYYILKKLLS